MVPNRNERDREKEGEIEKERAKFGCQFFEVCETNGRWIIEVEEDVMGDG